MCAANEGWQGDFTVSLSALYTRRDVARYVSLDLSVTIAVWGHSTVAVDGGRVAAETLGRRCVQRLYSRWPTPCAAVTTMHLPEVGGV